jgi:hypothetical protein
METKKYTTSYTSIIDKLDLEDLQKELIKSDWLDFINYLEGLIAKNYWRFRVYTTISIIGGISIPAISAFQIPEPYNKMVISIIGVITASCIGLNQSFKFNDKWKHFRRQVEIARIEGEKFIALADQDYSGKTHKDGLPVFIKNLSILKKEEIKDYFDSINNLSAKNIEK